MARIAKAKLDTRTARKALAPRSKPYAFSIAPRRVLGYLRVAQGAGRWLAVVEIGRGPSGAALRRQGFLALADDLSPADGSTVLSFAQAIGAAAAWQPEDGPRVGRTTVRQAFESYVAAKRAAGGEAAAEDARRRLLLHVLREDINGKPLPGPRGMGDREVASLTLTELRKWRDGLVEGRTRASVNRLLNSFRAMLNHAFDDKKAGIPTDAAWAGLESFERVAAPREDHYSEAEVVRLIAAARKEDPAFADLLAACFYCGARYGELCLLDVRHVDARKRILSIPGGKTGARVVTLSDEGAAFFGALAANRNPREPLLRTETGERWGRGFQQRRMKRALRAAGLPPSGTVYALRHTYISRAIERGAPLTLIAEQCGTSVAMIAKHYAKLLAEKRRELVERTAPSLRVVARRRIGNG